MNTPYEYEQVDILRQKRKNVKKITFLDQSLSNLHNPIHNLIGKCRSFQSKLVIPSCYANILDRYCGNLGPKI